MKTFGNPCLNSNSLAAQARAIFAAKKSRVASPAAPEKTAGHDPVTGQPLSPKIRWVPLIVFLVISIGGSFVWYQISRTMKVRNYEYDITQTLEHDPLAFTQGLLYHDGYFYESTGQLGESTLRKLELDGTLVTQVDLAPQYFGEGLALLGNRFYQITWQNKKCLVYDLNLQPVDQYDYDDEGWGLTTDGTHLIMSNGSPTLRFFDPDGFQELTEKRLTVRMGGSPVWDLNELEFIPSGESGSIFANVFGKDYIIEIDALTGEVIGRVDLSGLDAGNPEADVLNGIAFYPPNQSLVVTGKDWSHMYEIRLK